MLRALFALTLTCALGATSAHAVVYEIPLPGLLGTYGPATNVYERTTVFQLPGLPAVVRGASLRVGGTTEVGAILCGVPPTQLPWPTSVEGWIPDGPDFFNFWSASEPMPDTPGAFGWTAAFHSQTATWTPLLDGSAEIRLLGGPIMILLGGCSTLTPPPNVTIEAASILVDADIPVPSESATWGRIKSTYR